MDNCDGQLGKKMSSKHILITTELSFCAFDLQVIQHKTVKYQLLPLSPISIQRLSKYIVYFNMLLIILIISMSLISAMEHIHA